MNLFGFLILLVTYASLSMGIFVYSKNSTLSVNKHFLLFSLASVYWMFSFYAFTQAPTYEISYFWRKIFAFWPFLIPLQLHFILVFSEHWKLLKKKLIYVLLYFTPLIFVFFEFNDLIAETLVLENWGWVEINSLNLAFISASIWGILGGLFSLLLIYKYFSEVKHPLKKQQAKFIFIGLSIPNIFGLTSQIILPILSVRVPDFTAIGFGLGCIAIAYGILRYRLFILTPSTAAESILASMTSNGISAVTEKSFDLVFAVDQGTRFVYISPSVEQILGYQRKEMIGDNFMDYVSHSSISKATEVFTASLSGETIENFELEIKKKDGTTAPLLVNSIPIVKEGEVYGIQGIARDIKEFKDAERTKLELERSRESFIAMTSHELRTPLTIIRGYADFLSNSIHELDSERISIGFDIMKQNISRLEQLIQNVIDIDKVERQSFEMQIQQINFQDFLSNSVSPYENLLREQIEFSNLSEENEVVIEGDPIRLHQVIGNLIGNAINHTSKIDRKINISTEIQDTVIRVIISDNGAGIALLNIERIFERFVSVPTKYSVTGSGIGLYISDVIVKSHGGSLRAESEGENQGATFILELPRKIVSN